MAQTMQTESSVPIQPVYFANMGQPRLTLNVKVIRRLGVVHFVFGILSLSFGIILVSTNDSNVSVNSVGTGIWFGIWVLIVGIAGILSAKFPYNKGLNIFNMTANIFNACLCFVAGFFIVMGVIEYNYCASGVFYSYHYNCENKSFGIGIYTTLVILTIGEFVISIIASIYCCQRCCCGPQGCCNDQSTGSYIQQTTSDGQMVMMSVFPTNQTYVPISSIPSQPLMYHPGIQHGQILQQNQTRVQLPPIQPQPLPMHSQQNQTQVQIPPIQPQQQTSDLAASAVVATTTYSTKIAPTNIPPPVYSSS